MPVERDPVTTIAAVRILRRGRCCFSARRPKRRRAAASHALAVHLLGRSQCRVVYWAREVLAGLAVASVHLVLRQVAPLRGALALELVQLLEIEKACSCLGGESRNAARHLPRYRRGGGNPRVGELVRARALGLDCGRERRVEVTVSRKARAEGRERPLARRD